MHAERTGVLTAAGGASWEVEALRVLSGRGSGTVLLKRCVDLPDLLASAATGQASVAVVSEQLPGLDADCVAHLRSSGVAVVLVADPAGAARVPELPGVTGLLGAAEMDGLAAAVAAAAAETTPRGAGDRSADPRRPSEASLLTDPDDLHPGGAAALVDGRVLAVWGPTGAPGRTTVAVGVAAELALRGRDVLLVDADCYGGTVGQHLGVLDEASGLLAAARLANAGQLDGTRLAAAARQVAPGMRVLTGLPRADRWQEVREVAFDALLEAARQLCPFVVLDLGFSLEQSEQVFGSGAPGRNLMTVSGLDHADEILLVGSADPVGLARLARALVELPETVPAAATRVVVNRMRPSLGWGQKEVRAMVEGFFTPTGVHFLPDDPVAADRALVAGRSLVETGDSTLRSALAGIVDSLVEEPAGSVPAGERSRLRVRRRRADRAR